MKRIIVLLFCIPYTIIAQFTDDFERYNYTQRISPQSLNWITWSEDPSSGVGYIADEDGIVSNTDYPTYGETQHFANSGKQAMFIGSNGLGSQSQDVVLDLHNKSKGKWNLTWKMYVPKNNTAYYNFQEDTPINGSGNWAIQVYYNKNRKGTITDDSGNNIVNFNYPQNEWFEIKHTIDLDIDNIVIELITSSGTTEIYSANFLSNTQHLGGVDFYSNDKNNRLYIDDVIFEKTVPIEDVYIWSNNRWEDSSGNPLSGDPDTSYEVILKEPFTIGSSTATTSLNCLNLVLEGSGKLTIPSKTNGVVSGNLVVPSTNNINIDNGGSFVMLNNTAIINMPNPNSFSFIRTSEVMTNLSDFTYWSSPVENIEVSNFGSTAVYTYNTANYIDLFSGNGYPQISGTPDNHDDNGDDWTRVNNTDYITLGKGYAVLTSGTSSTQTVAFNGRPNNGLISIPVALSGDSFNMDDDWNLIGNPYPSAIDAKVFINSNINLSGTLYFWTHNTVLGGGSNTGPAGSNYDTNDYASFNLSGGVAANSGGAIPNGFIAAGQGFFMEVNNNGIITFNNDMRVVNTVDENTQFYKSTDGKKDSNESIAISNENRIWLNFSNNNGVFSQSLVAFLPEASDGYEGNYDGVKADSNLYSKFYSVLDDKELAIQGRSILTDEAKVVFGFYITAPEDFTISIEKLEGMVSTDNMNIYLIDHELNKSQNLKLGDYHFNVSEAGTNNTRFTLQIIATVLSADTREIDQYFTFIQTDNSFKIKADQIVENIEIYDILGKLLIQNQPNKKSFSIQTNNIKKGTILIVNATLENRTEINKKTIKY